MNKKTRNFSLLALAAGVVLVPIVRYIMKRAQSSSDQSAETPANSRKGFLSAYRGSHLPHHRKAPNNGHALH